MILDSEIRRQWSMAARCYRRGSSLGKKIGLAIADRLEEQGVTEADIDRLFPPEPCFSCGEHECRCPVDCPECEGLGVVAHPRGHEVACGRCWGDRTIPRELL